TSPQLLLQKETPISSGSATVTAKYTTRRTAPQTTRPGSRILVCQRATVPESRSPARLGSSRNALFTPHLEDLHPIMSGKELYPMIGQASPMACRKLQYSRLPTHHQGHGMAPHFILAQRWAYSLARMEGPRGRRVMMDPPTPLSKSFFGWVGL